MFLLILMNSIPTYSLISDLVNEVVLNRISFMPFLFFEGMSTPTIIFTILGGR